MPCMLLTLFIVRAYLRNPLKSVSTTDKLCMLVYYLILIGTDRNILDSVSSDLAMFRLRQGDRTGNQCLEPQGD